MPPPPSRKGRERERETERERGRREERSEEKVKVIGFQIASEASVRQNALLLTTVSGWVGQALSFSARCADRRELKPSPRAQHPTELVVPRDFHFHATLVIIHICVPTLSPLFFCPTHPPVTEFKSTLFPQHDDYTPVRLDGPLGNIPNHV